MNKKLISPVVIFFLIAAIMILMLCDFGNPKGINHDQKQARGVNSEISTNQTSDGIPNQNSSKNEKHDKDRMNRLMSLIRHDDVSIMFYGIVVDQDGTPIANANVDWRIGKPGYFSGPPDIRGAVIADQSGRFTISGETGRTLSIENIAKDGYRQTNLSYHAYSYGSVSGGPHIPDAKRPELFMLVKNDLPEVKRVKERGVFLDWNKDVNRIPLGVNNLELLVNATRDKKPDQVNGISWKVEFSMPDAELTEMDGSDAPFAPTNGYQKIITLYYDANDSKRHVNIDHRILVFQTHTGLFGKISYSLHPDREKNALYVTTYLNDYGKRNLE